MPDDLLGAGTLLDKRLGDVRAHLPSLVDLAGVRRGRVLVARVAPVEALRLGAVVLDPSVHRNVVEGIRGGGDGPCLGGCRDAYKADGTF